MSHQKEKSRIADGCLCVFGAVILYLSLFSGWGDFFGKTKTFGLVCLCMMDLLFLVSVVSQKTEQRGGAKENGAYESGLFRPFIGVLVMTALFFLYCLLDKYYLHWGNETRNCLVAGSAAALASLGAKKKK